MYRRVSFWRFQEPSRSIQLLKGFLWGWTLLASHIEFIGANGAKTKILPDS